MAFALNFVKATIQALAGLQAPSVSSHYNLCCVAGLTLLGIGLLSERLLLLVKVSVFDL